MTATFERFCIVCLFLLLLGPASSFGQFDEIINIPPDPAPDQIESNTQLNLFDLGELGANFQAGNPDGTSVNVEVNIFGGLVGPEFNANSGSTVNVTGGLIQGTSWLFSSELNVNGGELNRVRAMRGSYVDVDNGFVYSIIAGGVNESNNNVVVDVSGGEISFVTLNRDARLKMDGGFVADCYTQSLADDASIELCGEDAIIAYTVLRNDVLNLSAGTIGTLYVDDDGFGGRHSVAVVQDGKIGVFNFLGELGRGAISITGGDVGAAYVSSTTLNLSGGTIGATAEISGSNVDISGGFIADYAEFYGGDVSLRGGSIGNFLKISSGTRIDMTGGSIGAGFQVGPSVFTMRGGSIGPAIDVSGSFHLVGTEFQLLDLDSGELLMDLTPMLELGEPIAITERNVKLAGILNDGSPVCFELLDEQIPGRDYFNPEDQLSVRIDAVTSADSFSVERGFAVGGDLQSITESDDNYLELLPALRLNNDTESCVVAEFLSTVELADTNHFLLRFESSSDGANLNQTIELYNWNSEVFNDVDEHMITLIDGQSTVFAQFQPGLGYVQPRTGAVLARVTWKPKSSAHVEPWTVLIDLFELVVD